MYTVFKDGKVWDEYESSWATKKEDIPLYAVCYDSSRKQWWCWYHSWNRIDISQLPPIYRAWLLMMED